MLEADKFGVQGVVVVGLSDRDFCCVQVVFRRDEALTCGFGVFEGLTGGGIQFARPLDVGHGVVGQGLGGGVIPGGVSVGDGGRRAERLSEVVWVASWGDLFDGGAAIPNSVARAGGWPGRRIGRVGLGLGCRAGEAGQAGFEWFFEGA